MLSVSLYLFYRHSRVHRVLEGLGPRFRTLYTSLHLLDAVVVDEKELAMHGYLGLLAYRV